MDKRTIAKKIARVDKRHCSHPVKEYLTKVITCNNTIVIKIIDGMVCVEVKQGSICPYIPKTQGFAIWLGVDPENSEEPIADQKYTYQLKSLLTYF